MCVMVHEDRIDTAADYWSVLVPEMLVRDLERSLGFYRDLLGFTEKFSRPEDGFV